MNDCNLFWGSHGCDLPEGHEGDHTCGSRDPEGICSQFRFVHPDSMKGEVRFYYLTDPRTWGEWKPDWTAYR